jgi:hypothetical protein
MGGQACVFYGAAEFSRDTDFAVLSEPSNLQAIQAALEDLNAEVIALPPFDVKFLERGHAIHFRCRREDVSGMRVDIMSKMRGVDAFPELWSRRTGVTTPDGTFDLISLPDLVRAKKTQRDKDWPMIRRLVDRHYFDLRGAPTLERVRFWLQELRTPELLVEVAQANCAPAESLYEFRPFLASAVEGKLNRVAEGLEDEENDERRADKEYWAPLRQELESLRHDQLRNNG